MIKHWNRVPARLGSLHLWRCLVFGRINRWATWAWTTEQTNGGTASRRESKWSAFLSQGASFSWTKNWEQVTRKRLPWPQLQAYSKTSTFIAFSDTRGSYLTTSLEQWLCLLYAEKLYQVLCSVISVQKYETLLSEFFSHIQFRIVLKVIFKGNWK